MLRRLTRRVMPQRSLAGRLAPMVGALALLPACPFCEDVSAFLPQGSIEPAVLDMGPITTGVTCPATLAVLNNGNADLETVEGSAKLLDTDGTFVIKKVPPFVRLGGSEELIVDYTAGSEIGVREGSGVELTTNDPDNDGVLRAVISAFVAQEPVAIAKAQCTPRATAENEEPEPETPCSLLDFGAVPIGDPLDPIEQRNGVNLSVVVINDGNKDLSLQGAVINGGGDFAVLGVKRGSQIIEAPATIPAGRSGDCGVLTGADNTLVVDVKYAPTAIGAATPATLQILTDGSEGSIIEVPLSGQGADSNILTNPEIVVFSDVAEGASETKTVLVQNTGTETASVNDSCIDLEDDGTCDGLCTGASGDATLGGTLSCQVKKSDGSRDGKGFVLQPTDAAVGGDDERTIEIAWSPSAANPSIPASAVLALKSNIKNNKVFKVGLVGGNVGILEVDSTTPCAPDHCVQAQGTGLALTGSTTLTLENVGSATLTLGTIAASSDTPATIADDWTIGAPSSTSLAPGASATLTLTYANVGTGGDPNNDANVNDGFNLIIRHNGVLSQSLVSVRLLPPQ